MRKFLSEAQWDIFGVWVGCMAFVVGFFIGCHYVVERAAAHWLMRH